MQSPPGPMDYICANADKLAILLALESLAGLLSIVFFLVAQPRTPMRVVSGLNVAGVLVIGGVTAVLLWRCHTR